MSSTLTRLTDDVWTIYHPFRLMGMELGSRATIVELPSGRLLVVGPVPFDDDTAAEIEELGEVDTIVAPNLKHHLFFNEACRRWPDARALIPPGLDDKTDVVDRSAPMGQSGSIEETVHWRRIEGVPGVGEHVFVDPRTGVLVLADLAFHFPDPTGWMLRLVLWLNGTSGRFGLSRLVRMYIRDSEAFGESLADVLEFQWDSIVVAHGEPIEVGGREVFVEEFERYLPKGA